MLMQKIDIDSIEFQTNPWPIYKYLRENDPIHYSEKHRSYFLMKDSHIRKVFLDDKTFTVDHPFRMTKHVFGSTILDMDGESHHRIRRYFSDLFSSQKIDGYAQNIIIPIINEVLDEIAKKEEFDFVNDFAFAIPTRVVLKLLGLPTDNLVWLRERLLPIILFIEQPKEYIKLARKSMDEVIEYILEVASTDAIRNSNTVAAQIVNENITEGITREEILRQVLLFITAGTDTSIATICNTMVTLLKHPDILQKVRSDYSLLPKVIHETLRWEPPMHFTIRIVTKDIEIDDVQIPKNSILQLVTASSSKDEAKYVDPERFDPFRKDNDNLSFGLGRHKCIGMFLAEREFYEAFRLFFERVSIFELVSDELSVVEGRILRFPRYLKLKAAFKGGLV
jgi:cytochrome P450